MNRFKSLLVVLMMCWAFPQTMFAVGEFPDHHWQPEYSDFNMTATFAIRIDDVVQTSLDLELGAFVGEVCRASFHLILTPPPFNTGIYITEGYNIQGYAGETITFRLYDHSTESELDVKTAYSIPFVPNQNIGNAVNPQYIDFYSVSACYFALITDESQLVEGRRYLVANGFEGTVMAMSAQNMEDEVRDAVGMDCVNKKTNQAPAVVPVAGGVYPFMLESMGDQWSFYDGANMGYLATNNDGNMLLDEDPVGWTVAITPDGKARIMTAVSSQDQYLHYDAEEECFSCVTDESQYVFLFAKCDLINGTMASLDVADPARMLVVESGNILEVTDLSTVHVSNLVLEDGAQLLNASEGVLAMMQKEVTGYADVAVSDGWYTLASPMVAASVEEGSNLVFPEYDLYYLDETNLTQEEWRNYKNNANNGFTAFEEGRGYLYANATTCFPVFKGTLNHDDVTFPLTYTEARTDELKGFNLVGNPYPHNIYKGAGGAIDDNNLASGYYVLSNDGAWVPETYETAIAPGQGVLVQTAVAGNLNITKTNAMATGETNSQKTRGKALPRLAIYLDNGRYHDAAYLFMNKGSDLNKISHLNPDMPALSILKNGNHLAIAHLDECTESVDVLFDNKLPGVFTIKVEAKDWDEGSLHLIDNLTGADIDLLNTSTYTFKTTGREYASRFKLVLQGEDNTTDAPFAFFDGSEWRINDYEGAVMQVVDAMGRVVVSSEATPRFSTAGLPSGVYVFRFINNDVERTQKVIVK